MVLPELFRAVTGWQQIEIANLNDKQLACLAGGHHLKVDVG